MKAEILPAQLLFWGHCLYVCLCCQMPHRNWKGIRLGSPSFSWHLSNICSISGVSLDQLFLPATVFFSPYKDAFHSYIWKKLIRESFGWKDNWLFSSFLKQHCTIRSATAALNIMSKLGTGPCCYRFYSTLFETNKVFHLCPQSNYAPPTQTLP